MSCRALAALVALCAMLDVSPAAALYGVAIAFDSEPQGAKVYLCRGRKEELLGTTPFTRQMEFRSEISVLRLVFRKAAYQKLELKLSASQQRIVGKLEPAVLSGATEESDPALREMLGQLDPLVKRRLPELLAEAEGVALSLRAPCRLSRLDGEVYLVLFLALEQIDLDPSLPGKARRAALLKELWGRAVGELALSLARGLPGGVPVEGVLVDVAYDETRFAFGVNARVEFSTELQCVPGTRYESHFDSCAYYDVNHVCRGRTETVPVRDPCMYRVPVTKSDLKIDPTAQALANPGRIQYLIPRALARGGGSPTDAFDGIGLVLSDSAGKRLETRGRVPEALPGLP